MSKVIKGGKAEVIPIKIRETEEECFASLVALARSEDTKDKAPEAAEEMAEATSEVAARDEEREETAEAPEEEPLEAEVQEEPDIEEIINQKVVERLAERLAQVEQEAYEKGFAQGEKDGRELGLRQYQTMAKRLENLIEALEREREGLLEKHQRELVELVRVVAERIAFCELKRSPEAIFSCLREALALVVEKARVTIRLNPQDLELIEGSAGELALDLGRFQKVEFRPDPGISRGGCLLETDFGLIDATLEHRREELFKALDRALEENEDGS